MSVCGGRRVGKSLRIEGEDCFGFLGGELVRMVRMMEPCF